MVFIRTFRLFFKYVVKYLCNIKSIKLHEEIIKIAVLIFEGTH